MYRCIKNKILNIWYILYTVYSFEALKFYHLCIHTIAKNIYSSENLVSAPLACCEFSARQRSFVSQRVTLLVTAVYKKHYLREKVTKKTPNKQQNLNEFASMQQGTLCRSSCLYLALTDSSIFCFLL